MNLFKISMRFFACMLIVMIFASCKENEIIQEVEDFNSNDSGVSNEILEKLSTQYLRTQDVLMDVFETNPKLVKELATIGKETDGVLFKHLFDPANDEFQRLSPALKNFKNEFKESYFNVKGQQRTSNEDLEELEELIQGLISTSTDLYMPYINDQTIDDNSITIVATTTENQGNEVEGYRVNLNSNGRNSMNTERVTVNDDYASSNLTMAIMPVEDACLMAIELDPSYDCGGGSPGGPAPGNGDNGDGSDNIHDRYEDLERMSITVAAVRCNTQYDALINFVNNRGSEFDFVRVYPYYNGGANSQKSSVQVGISRKNIRNNNIVNVSAEWDGDWNESELVQGISIYEFDETDEEHRVTGTVQGRNTNGAAYYSNYLYDFSTKDGILYSQDVDRENYWTDIKNERDYGLGFHNGNAWRQAGGLKFALNTYMTYRGH